MTAARFAHAAGHPELPRFALIEETRGALRRHRLEAHLSDEVVVVASGLLAGAAMGHADITDYAFHVRVHGHGGALWIEVQRADGVRHAGAPAFVRVTVCRSVDGRTWARADTHLPAGIELARFREGHVHGFDEA